MQRTKNQKKKFFGLECGVLEVKRTSKGTKKNTKIYCSLKINFGNGDINKTFFDSLNIIESSSK